MRCAHAISRAGPPARRPLGTRVRPAACPLRRGAALCLGLLAVLALPAQGQAPAAAPPSPDAQVRLLIYPLGADTLLYEGLRTVRHEGGRVIVTTTFMRPDGTPLQRTEGVYEEATLAPLVARLEDLRSGEEETFTREGGSVRMSYRATGQDAPASATVDAQPRQVFTATVVPFILQEWERLVAGQEVAFRLLVPSRRDSYAFRFRREDGAGSVPGRLTVRMEPDTWLVRRLVEPLFFVLELAPPHRLREFRGRSSIKTDVGKDQDLRTVYRYPDEG